MELKDKTFRKNEEIERSRNINDRLDKPKNDREHEAATIKGPSKNLIEEIKITTNEDNNDSTDDNDTKVKSVCGLKVPQGNYTGCNLLGYF